MENSKRITTKIRKIMKSKYQKLVQSIYPNSVLLVDTHDYWIHHEGSTQKAIDLDRLNKRKFAVILMNNPSDKKVYLDFFEIDNLASWGFYYRSYSAWKGTWEKIEKKLLEKMSS